MPREQITYTSPRSEGDPSIGPADAAVLEFRPPTLHVGWHKEGEWVQVALQYDKAHLLELLANYEPNDDGSVFLWTDPLGRTACNKLIRVTRRARDQAYGRDE